MGFLIDAPAGPTVGGTEQQMKVLGKILKVFLKILLGIVVLGIVLLGVLSILEYKPAEVEPVEIAEYEAQPGVAGLPVVQKGTDLTIISWNVGYGALGDNATFFMDGGTDVYTADEDRVYANLETITTALINEHPDIVLLQETDVDSDRSRHVDEVVFISDALTGPMADRLATTFAYNFNVAYLPYPIPPIGRVKSGLLTLSKYQIASAERISLPCPFAWPVRTINLKRCLLVNRLPIEGSDNELVIVDLHLEAYDSGEGKIAQTKKLISVLKEERAKGNYVIAGGDFNQTFSRVNLTKYPKDPTKWLPGIINVQDFWSWQALMDPTFPTCRSLDQPYAGADLTTFQYYVIDGFIVSDNIQVKQLDTLDMGFTATDHNPVRLVITLN